MIYLYFLLICSSIVAQISLPVDLTNRQSVELLQLSDIGEYALIRKARPKIKSHYHTGIDIMRPSSNYVDELIYPVAKGHVISKRSDGPFAQLILEHRIDDKLFWTLYEHIAGIKVNLGDTVKPNNAIARFMNTKELQLYGWQFDHFILKS